MFTSQRIAKDVNFLSDKTGLSRSFLLDIRLKVVRSTKILVNNEVFDCVDNTRAAAQKFMNIMGGKRLTSQAEKLRLYNIYSLPPFPLMFIENETGGMLVEDGEDEFTALLISKAGFVLPLKIILKKNQGDQSEDFTMDGEYLGKARFNRTPETDEDDQMHARFLAVNLCEALLFMNLSNVRIHNYVPTKKENVMVPKPIQGFYEYKILDVFRERKRYVSLEEIKEGMAAAQESATDRRAHVVRGHFKEKGEKLFWWSSFMRCRKNAETIGVIEKGYRLRD